MTSKQIFSRFLLGAEIIIFTLYYWYGNGMKTIKTLQQEIIDLEEQNITIQQEIQRLTSIVQATPSWTLQHERIAREELQMAYPEEKIIVF